MYAFLWDVDAKFMERNEHVFEEHEEEDFDYAPTSMVQSGLKIT